MYIALMMSLINRLLSDRINNAIMIDSKLLLKHSPVLSINSNRTIYRGG